MVSAATSPPELLTTEACNGDTNAIQSFRTEAILSIIQRPVVVEDDPPNINVISITSGVVYNA